MRTLAWTDIRDFSGGGDLVQDLSMQQIRKKFCFPSPPLKRL